MQTSLNATASKTLGLADVAAKVGVSISTVSRVVNGSPLVAAKRRREIEAAIEAMGYKPDPVEKRKGLRKNATPWIKHHTVKVALLGAYDQFWITNYAPVFAYALNGIDEALHRYDIERRIERCETAGDLLKLLRRGDADGVLILNTENIPLPPELADYPAVAFMGAPDTSPCDRIAPDHERTGTLAAEYLRSKGCKMCAVIGGISAVYNRRASAFNALLQSSKIKVHELMDQSLVRGGARMHQASRSAVASQLSRLFRNRKGPAGIFSVSDIVTPHIYAELAAMGLRVGSDVHVVTCNNERPYLDLLHPAPAIIDIHAGHIGRLSVDQLLRRLENPHHPKLQTLVAPELILPEAEGRS